MLITSPWRCYFPLSFLLSLGAHVNAGHALLRRSVDAPESLETQACEAPLPESTKSSEDDEEPQVVAVAAPGERVRMEAYKGLEYQLFLPSSWKQTESKEYPVVVFLHGMGDGKFSVMNSQSLPRLLAKDQSTSFDSRKCWCLEPEYVDAKAYAEAPPTDSKAFLDKVEELKSPMANCSFAEDFEAIVVMPQGWLPENPTGWTDAKFEQVKGLVKQTMSTYRGDPTRVVLTGQSMGGAGAWNYGSKGSGLWSAVNVICAPMASSEIAASLSEVPVWVVGWEGDGVSGNDEMVEHLKARSKDATRLHYTRYVKAPGPPDPKYRTMLNHASYDLIYRDPRLWQWAFEQHRPSARQAWASVAML